ncbi:MAG: type II toxin-antitoxin system HicA family toxin [Verrucomicrobiota bacterium]
MKLPRDLSGEEVCRALVRLGFEFRRQTGSHRHYAKGSLHPCVPMHTEIRPKTLPSILKQADITLEDLLDNL